MHCPCLDGNIICNTRQKVATSGSSCTDAALSPEVRSSDGRGRTSRTVSRILCSARSPALTAAIHLGTPLPTPSSGLPGSSGGQPSNAACLALLRVGFTEPLRSPGALVVSYTTVSPLPTRLATDRRSVFCGTVPRVTPGGRYPPPCPVESGLSSARRSPDPTRPPVQLIRTEHPTAPPPHPPSRRLLPRRLLPRRRLPRQAGQGARPVE
jgi:hypothetical protein